MPDLETIRLKLDRLRRADSGRVLFGSATHGYRLESRLTENDARHFEKRHEVAIPEEYRAFLTELGNGGAGPFYGIFPLGLFDGSGRELEPWEGAEGIVGRLALPFTLRGAWNMADSRLKAPGEFASDADEDRWHAELDAEYWNPDLVNGAFPICHHGCALRTHIIVTGPERGNVWVDRRAEYGGIEPHVDAGGRHLTFVAWFERWLDESLVSVGAGT